VTVSKQYIFSLPFPAQYREDNFMVAACNRDAWQWVTSASAAAAMLYGPQGCGKSHLGHIWAQREKASLLPVHALKEAIGVAGHWLIEDIEQLQDERALLHFFNACKEQGGKMLFTCATAPHQLPFTLPDLTSRLRALPAAAIGAPDDEVLAAAMRKQFTDRQIKVEDEVIAYILPRIERSFTHIQQLVKRIDEKALSEHKSITIPFVRTITET
jgi:chromosomal replication initiation ATPase DnaA